MDKGSLIAIAFCMMLFTACSEDYESTSVPMEPPLDLSLVSFVEPCKTDSTDTCLYGMVTDDRDGKTYKTVEIGNQVWMAENLNYETPGSFCYNDSPKECETFGRLYWWAAAMDTEGKWQRLLGYSGCDCRQYRLCGSASGNRAVVSSRGIFHHHR